MASTAANLAKILERYFSSALRRFLEQSDIHAVLIGRGGYLAASPLLKAENLDVDAWPVSPAGLFVVPERTVYLRSVDVMTVVHEHGHAIDAALGENGRYRSTDDQRIRRAFADARDFVTAYAASGIDEWVAEGIRALVGANVASSPWPDVSPERFQKIDPNGFALIADLIAEAESRAVFEPGEQIELDIAS